MNYGQIRKYDIANGPGIRTSIFVTGCSLNCKNCFNKDYQNPSFGNPWTEKEDELIASYLSDPNVAGLTILGGEPFENAQGLISLLKKIKTNKSIWIYSGYTYDFLIKNDDTLELLKLVDVLVDGPFIESMKDLNLYFRGSRNQRIIDVKESLLNDELILHDGYI